MKHRFLLFLSVLPIVVFAQELKKLHHAINREFTQNVHPKLSPDGRYMVYMSDLDEPRKQLRLLDATYIGKDRWTSPQIIENGLVVGSANAIGSYSLSYDLQTMYLASQRHGGVGKFDIWISEKGSDGWKKPINVGKPLNSEMHDGDPCISPDNNTLYFCRCEHMTQDKASGCTLMMSQRRGSSFGPAVALPNHINTGNSMAPLLLADGETLIFASDQNGGKGGLDLFLTRKTGTEWSEPIALDYLNDETDNRYISIPAKGDIAYFSKEMEKYNTLVMMKIPEKYQQKKVQWVAGKIAMPDDSEPLVHVINMHTDEEAYYPPMSDGTFSLFLAAGWDYDVSIRDKNGQFTFVSTRYELGKLSENERVQLSFAPIRMATGITIPLLNVASDLEELDGFATNELGRVVHILKNQPALNAHVQFCHREETATDSTLETESDTITTPMENPWLRSAMEAYIKQSGIPEGKMMLSDTTEGCATYLEQNPEREKMLIVRFE